MGKKFLIGILAAVFAAAAVYGVYRVADRMLTVYFSSEAASSAISRSGAASSSGSSAESSSSVSSGSVSSANASSALSPAVLPGIFSDYADQAQTRLSQMTLKEKVGQVFLFTCPSSGQISTIDTCQPAGYCLLAKDFQDKTAQEVKKTLASYQNSSKVPMLLCCDEEGGTVVRISQFPALAPHKFASPQEVFASGGMAAITSDTVKKAQLLKSLGLNLNLAPDCDVSTNPNDFINARSFGKNAAQTAQFVAASVAAYQSQGLSCTLKHFPGYGNNADTHTGVAKDERSYQSFQQSDFLPFEAGIKAGAPCVMVCHNIVECMDAKRPASLSPQVHDILRSALGFTGVIVTDSLSMQAVKDYANGQNPCVEAFLAGNDLLLTSDNIEGYNALYAAVQKGTVSEKRLNASVLRILAWKYQAGILK
jgi:beta-N-acetylhexosaminidase